MIRSYVWNIKKLLRKTEGSIVKHVEQISIVPCLSIIKHHKLQRLQGHLDCEQ